MADVIAYTDGGCRGNPGGIGGWGFVLIHPSTGRALERAGGIESTTNQRMELTAAIEALRAIVRHNTSVLIHSDSKYLINCATKWMPGWKKRGWRRADGPLKNVELLRQLDPLLAGHAVRWQWVAGHSGNRGNDHADRLANEAMDRIANGRSPGFERRFRWDPR